MISVQVTPKVAGPIVQPTNQAGLVPSHWPKRSQRFSASVANDPANAGVKWSIEQGAGQIDETGLFFPPDNSGKKHYRGHKCDR
jgi:hypothetical protein